MATIARFRALARFRGVTVGGLVGWLLWLVVQLTFLTGFKNHVAALAQWTIAFIGRGRAEWVITHHQVVVCQTIAALRAGSGPWSAALTGRPTSSRDAADAAGAAAAQLAAGGGARTTAPPQK